MRPGMASAGLNCTVTFSELPACTVVGTVPVMVKKVGSVPPITALNTVIGAAFGLVTTALFVRVWQENIAGSLKPVILGAPRRVPASIWPLYAPSQASVR